MGLPVDVISEQNSAAILIIQRRIHDTYHLHRSVSAQVQSVLQYTEIRNRKPVNNKLIAEARKKLRTLCRTVSVSPRCNKCGS